MNIAIIGSGRFARDILERNGFPDVIVLPTPTDSSFDEATHTWLLHTGDGAGHEVQVVVDERPAGHDPAPYLGVAVHGTPNYFWLSSDHAGQARYVAECLRTMEQSGSTRIEVRYSTQRVFNDRAAGRAAGPVAWRRLARKIPSAFDLSSDVGVEDEVFDGTAVVRIGADERSARVRLTGHLDPIDGLYHWQGTLFDALTDDATRHAQSLHLRVGDRSADGRITERSAWGTCSVSGVGAPPFPLDDVDVAVPRP